MKNLYNHSRLKGGFRQTNKSCITKLNVWDDDDDEQCLCLCTMYHLWSLLFIFLSPFRPALLILCRFLFYFIATYSAFIHIWWCWISRFTISSIIHLMSDEWMAGITTLWWRWLLNIRTRNISLMAFNFLFPQKRNLYSEIVDLLKLGCCIRGRL